jgi:hypothetical protein
VYRFDSYSLALPASVPTWLYNVVVYEPGFAQGCYVSCQGLFTILVRERSGCVIVGRTVHFVLVYDIALILPPAHLSLVGGP